MGVVRIDVRGMGDVVRGLEQGVVTLTDARLGLASVLERFDLDESRAWSLQSAIDWASTELPGLRRRLALAQALEGSNPAWPVGAVELDSEPAFSSMSAEAARAAGLDLARHLNEGGQPPEEEIALLEELCNDPYFASAFAAALDPEQLAGIVLSWSRARTPAGAGLDDAEWAERNAWYQRAVDALSTTLGTATRATGDLALPAGYAQRWLDAMTAPPPGGLYPDGTGMVGQANALSLLLSTGRFSLSFLGTVADGVYGYERSFVAEYPDGSLWGPRSGDPSTLNAVYDGEGNQIRDPLAGIMAALAKDPAAAQNFFAAGGARTVQISGQDLQVSARLAYLLCDRTWAMDATNGGALGQALVAATTVLRDRAGTGMISAQIASQALALIGEQAGEHGVGGEQMWDGLRPYIAQVLASYGADVFNAKVVGDDGPADGWYRLGSGVLFPDDLPYGARLDLESLERIIATLGQDQGDFAPFLAGMFPAGNLAMDTGLARAMNEQSNAGASFLAGIPLDSASSSITNSAEVVGWALDTGFGGAKADEAAQKKRMAAIADALSLIAGAPFVPQIKPQWLAWGVNQVKTRVPGAVRNSAPTDASATYQDLNARARDDLTEDVMNLLLRNLYFDETAINGAGATYDVVFEGPPSGTVTYSDEGMPLYFNTDSDDYMNRPGFSGGSVPWFPASSTR